MTPSRYTAPRDGAAPTRLANGSARARISTPISGHLAAADVTARATYTVSCACVEPGTESRSERASAARVSVDADSRSLASTGSGVPARARQKAPCCNLANASTAVP